MKTIYLDHAATTPVCPAAAQAAVEAMTKHFGNPSSQYPLGKAAAKRREEDRAAVAAAEREAPLLVGTSVIPRPAPEVFEALM